nr:PREDICTED: spermine oxidase-like [Bemisia tabaci]
MKFGADTRLLDSTISALTHSRMNCARIIVVGGGAAGTAAATRLVQNGFENVTLLEAGGRLGGRCHTIALGEEHVDLGAQWIHGEEGNAVYAMAAPLNLTKDSIVSKASIVNAKFFKPDGSMMDSKISDSLLLYCFKIAEKIHAQEPSSNRSLSLGDVFMKSFNENLLELKDVNICDADINQILEWFHKFENSLEASDSWYDVSFEGYRKYEECNGNLNVAWKTGGYSNVIDLLLQRQPKSKSEIHLNVQFGKEVTKIVQGEHELVLTCADGSVFTADHTIVCVSLGVLKANVPFMFNPPLPGKKLLAINTLAMGVAEKLFIQFPYRWWPDEWPSLQILLDSNIKEELKEMKKEWLEEVFSFFVLDNAPNTLCGWVGGNAARYVSNIPDEEIKNDLLFLLKRYLSKLYQIPNPVRFARSNWYGNTHFRGSYSFVTVQANENNSSSEDLAEPILDAFGRPVIMFAGEATHSHFFSTVHGAIETGWREADRLLSYYSKVQHVNTAIIGGGMAGLGAAVTLEKNNVDYVILEAQNHLGGRIQSINEGSTVMELGAQWLHGTENGLYQWAQEGGLLSDQVGSEGKGLYLRDDKTVVSQTVVDRVSDEVNLILKEMEDFSPFRMKNLSPKTTTTKSVGEYLAAEFKDRLSKLPEDILQTALQLFNWHWRFQIIDNACDSLDSLPIEEWGSYSLNGSQDNIVLKNGYSSLVKLISSALSQDRIKLNTAVKKIRWYGGASSDHVQLSSFNIISSNITDELISKLNLKNCTNCESAHQLQPLSTLYPVSILCENGIQILARHVIVTCSLGFLKKHHHELFSPPLPLLHRNMVNTIGFGAIEKIFLIFEQCWWNQSTEGFQLLWTQVTSHSTEKELGMNWIRDVTGFDVLSREPPILVGWVGGPGAKVVQDLSEEKLAQDCQVLLQKFLHEKVPLPKKVVRSQWISNPFIKGGYSHATRNCQQLGLRPVDLNKVIDFCSVNNTVRHPVILFAGEANSEHDFSTTHGAYHSGIDRASILVEHSKIMSKL